MVSSMAKMTTQHLRTLLAREGWKEDAYGHMQLSQQVAAKDDPKHVVTREYRVKMQDISVRVEVRGERQSDGTRPWIRYGGAYLKDVVELPDGRFRIGSLMLGKPAKAA